jgi:subtilisin-like proprotein convertase family protein
VGIYDYTWSWSSIGWTGSSDWRVEKVDVEIYLYHTYPSDLYIDLESPEGTYGIIVDQTLPPDPDWVYLTKTFETEFDGEMAFNDYWTLWIYDCAPGDEGYLDWWAITLYCYNKGGPAALAGQKEERVIKIVGRPGRTGHGGRVPINLPSKPAKKGKAR